jgi:hypothetical protein
MPSRLASFDKMAFSIKGNKASRAQSKKSSAGKAKAGPSKKIAKSVPAGNMLFDGRSYQPRSRAPVVAAAVAAAAPARVTVASLCSVMRRLDVSSDQERHEARLCRLSRLRLKGLQKVFLMKNWLNQAMAGELCADPEALYPPLDEPLCTPHAYALADIVSSISFPDAI